MRGLVLIFYKMKVMCALSIMVETSWRPSKETIVHCFIPPAPNLDTYLTDGMKSLDNQQVCCQCYEELMQLIVASANDLNHQENLAYLFGH